MGEVIQKIIKCTETGLTYRELLCIQKFLSYVFFRYEWLRNVVVKSLSHPDDPSLTTEKLMELGIF